MMPLIPPAPVPLLGMIIGPTVKTPFLSIKMQNKYIYLLSKFKRIINMQALFSETMGDFVIYSNKTNDILRFKLLKNITSSTLKDCFIDNLFYESSYDLFKIEVNDCDKVLLNKKALTKVIQSYKDINLNESYKLVPNFNTKINSKLNISQAIQLRQALIEAGIQVGRIVQDT